MRVVSHNGLTAMLSQYVAVYIILQSDWYRSRRAFWMRYTMLVTAGRSLEDVDELFKRSW